MRCLWELSGGGEQSVQVGTTVAVCRYPCGQVFGPDASQKEVFDGVVLPLVGDTCSGLHTAVYTYGGASTGKSYTMEGALDTPAQQGQDSSTLHKPLHED